MPFLKKLLYYGLLAALTLLALEGMARAAYFLAFAEWYNGSLPAVAAANSTPPPAATRAETTRTTTRRVMIHPWYGYALNNAGYRLNSPLPRPKQADTVTIGLLGGSVAFENAKSLRRALSRHFAANNLLRRPRFLNLSLTGSKQPHQANAAAHHLLLGGHFDIIVNLDGFNEISFSNRNVQSGVFPWFPWGRELRVRDFTAMVDTLVGRIALLCADQDRRQQAAATHPLRYTALYGILHHYQVQQTARRIIQLNHDLAATRSAYSLESHVPRSVLRSETDLQQEHARVWYRGSLLLAELAALAGAEYYHFLQPNQYLPNSKPLTAAELACCWQPESYGQDYRAIHPRLVQLGAKLPQPKAHFFDLSLIFRDNRETLYRDECCHLNVRGNELLTAAMVERMAPALLRVGNSLPPSSGLDAATQAELLIDGYFQVYRHGHRRLVYVRESCTPADLQPHFFLHITPVDNADLPPERRQYGFDNWDFSFATAGRLIAGRCTAGRQLPDYPIAAIRTGQYVAGQGKLWEQEYRFAE